MSDKWQERSRPPRLERRYLFENYEELRDFLDRAADLSEAEDYYPYMGFGRDYVNITIHVEYDATELSDNLRQFAVKLDALIDD